MCGITGYFNFEEGRDKLIKATSILEHRGPDDSGLFYFKKCGLGHRRLSILDLSNAGHQPMESQTGRFQIVYNGEIYNYLELKSELVNHGISFEGHSDTEVIVNGFELFGNSYFKRLNGIFAIAIFDTQLEKLFLARDRFGVKPLYLYQLEGLVVFGSEIKSILEIFPSERTINQKALHEFLYFGYSLGENTLWSGIKKVLPGNIIEIDSNNSVSITKYWSHQKDISIIKTTNTEAEVIKKVYDLLENAVRRQLISDVPIGIFLSGGIDSSAITAIASKNYNDKIKTYSAGFDFDNGNNELPLAAKTAKKFGTDHSELFIKGEDLPNIIEKLVWHHDEPFSDAANLPLYLMTEKVKGECKVILQGDGGDELFGGYPRYHIMHKFKKYSIIFKSLNFLRPVISNKFIRDKTDRFYPLFNENNENKFAKFLSEEKQGIPELMYSDNIGNKIKNSNPFQRYIDVAKEFEFLDDDVQRLLWIDTKIILPDQFLEKVDKSTMANSVEVRVPFLDYELADYMLALPSALKVKHGIKKYLLKKALENVLPKEVLYGPKRGFGVPYGNWLKGPLYDYMNSKLHSDYIKDIEIFDYSVLDMRIKEHKLGINNWGFTLWKALNLSIWLEQKKIVGFGN